MDPSRAVTSWTTPEVPSPATPPGNGQLSLTWCGHAAKPAAALRYSAKFWVVPDRSDRPTVVIGC